MCVFWMGRYNFEVCFLVILVFSATVKMNHGIVFLKKEINFQHIFKVSTKSRHYETITKLVRRYFEAGMLDRIFVDIHRDSHK